MPRSRDECWHEVEREKDQDSNKRHPRVTCKHCLIEWTSNEKARVIEHLQRCASLPETLWRTYQPHRLDPTIPSAQEIQQQQRARTRGIENKGIGPMSTAEQDSSVAACAQWIHSTGLNLNITEHPAFRAFVHSLRPGFKVPTRHQLSMAMVDAPLMLIAYLVDPQQQHCRPAILDSSEETQNRFLQTFVLKYCNDNNQKSAEILAALSLLQTKLGPFNNDMAWMASAQMTPIQWWHNCWLETQPDLAELSILALAIAPNGDAPERNWSPHNFVHQLKRNQLNQAVFNRLMFTFWNMRLKHGWVDSIPTTATHDQMDQDADFSQDISGFPSMHG